MSEVISLFVILMFEVILIHEDLTRRKTFLLVKG